RPRCHAPGEAGLRPSRPPEPRQDLSGRVRRRAQGGCAHGPGRGGELVVTPDTPEALAAGLAEAARDGYAVVPVGGGRAATMGAPLERADIELGTGRLDNIIEHSQA